MSDGDFWHGLAGAKNVTGFRAKGRCGGGARGRRSRRGPLHARIHVAFVIVANVEHIVVALEHARKTLEANVGRATVAALRDDAYMRLVFHPQAAATPVATAAALPKSECSHGTARTFPDMEW